MNVLNAPRRIRSSPCIVAIRLVSEGGTSWLSDGYRKAFACKKHASWAFCRATWQVHIMDKSARGKGDRVFLERQFHKLLMNFTWWVNRKDALDNNVFEGGLPGLDNIGIFDRSAPLPSGQTLEQADGTSGMAMFCLDMLTIALELAIEDPVYEDLACKFFERFVYIAAAMDRIGVNADELWDEEDGFFYNVLRLQQGQAMRLKVRSMVGLIPLFASAVLPDSVFDVDSRSEGSAAKGLRRGRDEDGSRTLTRRDRKAFDGPLRARALPAHPAFWGGRFGRGATPPPSISADAEPPCEIVDTVRQRGIVRNGAVGRHAIDDLRQEL